MIDMKLTDIFEDERVPFCGVTVADLRKALEGLRDDIPVVRKNEGYAVIAESVGMKQYYEATDDDVGCYIDPNGSFMSDRYEGKPKYTVFVID